jgi:hypothetical protein
MNSTYWKISDGGTNHLYPRLTVEGNDDFDPASTGNLDYANFVSEMAKASLTFGRSSRTLPDFLSIGTTDLVSSRLAALLSNPIPSHGLTLQRINSSKPDGYFAVRAPQIDCIDPQSSEVNYWGNTKLIKSIRHLSLDSALNRELKIFQPLGLQMLFISAEMKSMIDAQGIDVSLTKAEFVRLG